MANKNILTGTGLWLNKDGKKICYCPWTHFEVANPNGDVTMCPDNQIILGNINKNSILEIWNGKMYQQVRKTMYELGGEKMCSPDCLLLNGMKDSQDLSWYTEVDSNSQLYQNALKNVQEIFEGKEILESLPRWIKIALSFKCNFRCYHCCQESERGTVPAILNDNFLEELKKHLHYYQNIFILGGEPTLFPNFREILKLADDNNYLKFGTVTNASNIEDVYEYIQNVSWSNFSISLDAASEETYKKLRHPKMWNKVMSNIKLLSDLGKKKNFRLNISMTLNSVNCHELYDFVKMCSSLDAIPKINLVTNIAGLSFQFKYLWFSEKQKTTILNHIRAIGNNFNYTKDETGLTVLERYFAENLINFHLKQGLKVLKLIIKPLLPSWFLQLYKKIKIILKGA